jgi:hypothetical protein
VDRGQEERMVLGCKTQNTPWAGFCPPLRLSAPAYGGRLVRRKEEL